MVEYEKRQWWVDYAKFIAIFLIVFVHLVHEQFGSVLESYGIIYNYLMFGSMFHVPVFFFVSGYLYKVISPKIALKKYFKRLFIPFIFFTVLGIVIYMAMKGYYTGDLLIPKLLNLLKASLISKPNLFPMGNYTIWFLLALFNVFIIFSLLKHYIKKDLLVLIPIILLNIILVIIKSFGIYLYLSLDSAILGLTFFYGGYLFRKYNLIEFFKNNYINILLFLVFLGFALIIFYLKSTFSMQAATWSGNFLLAYIGAFSGIFMVVAISSILSKLKYKLIYLISISTLTIMGLERFLRNGFYVFWKGFVLNGYPIIGLFVITLLVLLSSVLAFKLLNKFCPELIGNPKANSISMKKAHKGND